MEDGAAVTKVTATEELLMTINDELSRFYGLNRRLRTIKSKVSGSDLEKDDGKDNEDPSTLLQKLSLIGTRITDSNNDFNNLLDQLESTI